MKDHDLLYVRDIIESLTKIEKYVRGLPDDEFLKNEEKQEVVLFNLQIIGEAASKISKGLRRKHPDINWKELSDSRNLIVHEYFNIKPGFILYTIKTNLPKIHKQILEIEKEIS